VNNREPPSNANAEWGVLGSLLVNNKTLDKCIGLEPEHFYWPEHGMLFDCIRKRIEAGRPTDAVSIKDNATLILEGKGGIEYLIQIVSCLVSPIMAGEYAHLIRDCALRRSTIEIAQAAIDAAYGDDPGLAISTTAIAALEQATARYSLNKPLTMGSAVAQAVARAEAAKRGDNQALPLMSGIRPLDGMWRGIHAGTLDIIGGRAGSGKTALARQIARHVSLTYGPVAFFSLEMPGEHIGLADLSSVSDISADTIRLGQFNNKEAEAMLLAQRHLDRLPIHIMDTPAISIEQAISRLRGMKNLLGIRLAIVDHRDLFGRDANDRDDLGWYRSITQLLKVSAKSLNIPIILLVQLSRDIERRQDKTPKMSDLMYSGEADADTIILLHREGDSATASFVKRRFGPLGNVRMHFAERSTTFGSWT
jgi:replicative DNA helicase